MSVVPVENVVPKSDYEGAGFLMKYNGNYIFGKGIEREDFDIFGGKRDYAADTDAYATAVAELFEELGGPQFDTLTWRDRCKVIEEFQPYTKKWIINYVLELNAAEYEIVKDANVRLQSWPDDEVRDYSQTTKRLTPVRKTFRALYLVPENKFNTYIWMFNKHNRSENRMGDAKEFGMIHKLDGYCMITGEIKTLPLRAYNIVIFENTFCILNTSKKTSIYPTIGLTVLAIALIYYFYSS